MEEAASVGRSGRDLLENEPGEEPQPSMPARRMSARMISDEESLRSMPARRLSADRQPSSDRSLASQMHNQLEICAVGNENVTDVRPQRVCDIHPNHSTSFAFTRTHACVF